MIFFIRIISPKVHKYAFFKTFLPLIFLKDKKAAAHFLKIANILRSRRTFFKNKKWV